MPETEVIDMGLVNLGGRMPDGTMARELLVEESEFVCASGTALAGSLFKQILGKLCLTRTALVMLPYEGAVLKVAEFVVGKLRAAILGEFADMADFMEKLGLVHNGYEILDEVLVLPLALLDGDARVQDRSFLFIRGGGDLIVSAGGEQFAFNLKMRGHEAGGFASAEDFCEAINVLRDEVGFV